MSVALSLGSATLGVLFDDLLYLIVAIKHLDSLGQTRDSWFNDVIILVYHKGVLVISKSLLKFLICLVGSAPYQKSLQENILMFEFDVITERIFFAAVDYLATEKFGLIKLLQL